VAKRPIARAASTAHHAAADRLGGVYTIINDYCERTTVNFRC
jgi:hypothetical protein